VCRIVGGGELRDILAAKIEELNLRGFVELVGPKTQQEVIKFLSQADCYVQPSVIAPDGQMEGIPVALMEAMASTVPVVATDISGITELVRHRETGLIVSQESSTGLADAIAYIMYHKEDANKLATAGHEFVSKEFMLTKNARMLADLFNGFVR
jgi:glycosyltransferase involved in cell wall biosynthesis